MGQVFLPDPRAQYNVLRVLLAAVQVRWGVWGLAGCEAGRACAAALPQRCHIVGLPGNNRLLTCSVPTPLAACAGVEPGCPQARPV